MPNAAFSTSPVVTAEDGAGNVITNYSGTVALSIKSGTGTSGAVLTGCSAVNLNGATTFTGCKIDKPGTGYVLVAADGAFTVESNPFNVVGDSRHERADIRDHSVRRERHDKRHERRALQGRDRKLVHDHRQRPRFRDRLDDVPACPANWTRTTGTNSVTCTDTATAAAGSMAVSANNNASATTNLTVTITLDATAPTDSISLASASGAFLAGSTIYFNKNTGGSFKLADSVTDNGAGPASATFPGLSATGWSGHTTGETVSSGTGSAPTIAYTSGTYTFSTSGANTSGTVTSKDVLGNTSSPGAALTFTADTTAPTLTFPVNAASYTNAVWDAAAGCATSRICGTATDTGSGIQKVEISIQQGSGNYWNGSSFSSGSQFWNLGTGTTSWSLPFPFVELPGRRLHRERADNR